jgi:transcriptional regulator with XRE-family HTH domain
VDIRELIREGRESKGWSQGRLAELLCAASGRPNVTRDEVKRWESGKVIPGPFWLGHLADVLGLLRAELEHAATVARMERRAMLAASGAVLLTTRRRTVADMLASVAGGDESWMSRQIAPYDFALSLAQLIDTDRGTRRRLVKWLDDGSTSLLRGNSQGTLFKSRQVELVELAEQSMRRGEETRRRCMKCFARHTFGLSWIDAAEYSAAHAPAEEIRTLTELLADPKDASNRWCAAVHLGEAVKTGSQTARHALLGALRTETSRENLRAIGLGLSGERPWK